MNDFDTILAPRYAAIVAVRNNLTTHIPHYVPHQWREPRATKLVIQDNPDGKYLIKVAAPRSGSGFGLKKERRRSQGVIHGKRCGANVDEIDREDQMLEAKLRTEFASSPARDLEKAVFEAP
ncbi:MAG: hypothetical protein WAM06_11020 [Methyloceanibacter sp.]